MSFAVVPVPSDNDRFAKAGTLLVEAAHALGMNIDAEGFFRAWAGNMVKVLVEREEDKIVGMAFLSVGKRWVDSTVQASVLEYRDPSQHLMQFVRTIAHAFNADGLFYEHPQPILEEEGRTEYKVIREQLR